MSLIEEASHSLDGPARPLQRRTWWIGSWLGIRHRRGIAPGNLARLKRRWCAGSVPAESCVETHIRRSAKTALTEEARAKSRDMALRVVLRHWRDAAPLRRHLRPNRPNLRNFRLTAACAKCAKSGGNHAPFKAFQGLALVFKALRDLACVTPSKIARPPKAFQVLPRPCESFQGLPRPSQAFRGRPRSSKACQALSRPSEVCQGVPRPQESGRSLARVGRLLPNLRRICPGPFWSIISTDIG